MQQQPAFLLNRAISEIQPSTNESSISIEKQKQAKDTEELSDQEYFNFEPENIPESQIKQQFSIDFNRLQSNDQNQKELEAYKPQKNQKEEPRSWDAHENGGKKCHDKLLVSTLRGISKDIIKQIGKKIISGDFNLTTISFPIRAMIPKSVLESVLYSTCQFPLYINLAANSQDPIERLKLTITASISSFIVANTFYKPLNPILGETLHGQYIDGTQLYAEQISHHPPISYIFVEGKNYKSYGYFNFKASAGLNSLKVMNSGKKFIKFADGQLIEFNQSIEQFSGTFIGATKHESLGKIDFLDRKNNIHAYVEIGKIKKKPSDYFEGEIIYYGQSICKIYGTYLGFIDFNNVRYWDYRKQLPYKNYLRESQLQSDQSKRSDKILLAKGRIEEAQKAKENLENIQRKDALLRKNKKKIQY